jgi:hypothetical protein
MKNPPLLYVFIYKLIKQKANGRKIIPHQEVLEVLRRRLLRIPRIYHYQIIKELGLYKLLRKIDKRKYEIVGGNIDNLLNQYNSII